jgi:Na+/H+-dicarboxylate symporter
MSAIAQLIVAFLAGIAIGAFFTWLIISIRIVGDALDPAWESDYE